MHFHFSGIAGVGMNPLARLMRSQGHFVQGSDRSFDQGKNREVVARLTALGIVVKPQDGSAITADLDRFIYSTAVEAETPEVLAARRLGIERVPRPALLAQVVDAGHPGVAIAGTSGKSTITGMVGWLTREAGVPATVLGGAALAGEGGSGCFLPGPVDGPVAAEACESDGTLTGYHAAIGLIHNISRDHGEVESLRPQFEAFAKRSGRLLVNVASPEALELGRAVGARTYGVGPADARLEVERTGPERAAGRLTVGPTTLELEVPQPGLHNLENATAAALIALELGIAPATVERLMARFPGVARRFEVIGVTPDGIRVVDDYAHNGEKLRAAITTAQSGARRVLAVFQPHGFGPARFLRSELQEMMPRLLRPQDRLCYAEIFYAGGTVARDISSRMLADDLPARLHSAYAPDHRAVIEWIRGEARPGDTVLLMGARDPELPALARAVFAALDSDARRKA
ncbi:MAG TPA: Mur ligase domain-containing protein [Candidatus Bathyarchaeia archaeon]|nr:Mur ligase domain-containing protein [Candidatus Bathyarchaeia archaeon]